MLNLFSRWGKKAPNPAALKRVDPLEDVQRLYNELNLDPSGYHRFDTTPLPETSLAPKPEKTEIEAVQTEPETTTAALTTPEPETPEIAPAPVTPPLETPASPAVAAVSPAKPIPDTKPKSFSLLSHFARNTLRAASIDAPVVGFASFSGGVGKSTLSAALATSLLSRDQRCLVLGQTLFSPLPYYLGWKTQEQDESENTVVHINQPIEAIGQSLNLFISETGSRHLVAEARNTVPKADLILYDLEASPHIIDAFASIDLLIVPLRPDINALIIINRIEQALSQMEATPRLGVFYVLNQFDEGKSLHREIRQTLKTRLGDRLLDVVIPWDDSVQEALANGRSPQAHQPDSPFARAADSLSRWLEQTASLPARA